MKNIFKSLFVIAIFSLTFISCEDEQDLKFLTADAEFEILTPGSGDGVALSPETPNNPGLTLSWSKADYGTPTEVTYFIEIDKTGDDFDTPYVITSTTNTYASITSDALNGAVTSQSVGLTPFNQGSIDIRIKAVVGAGSNESYSNTISYLVTSYSTDLPKLAVPGNHQGWDPPTAPRIAASAFGETDYEGYVWLDGGHKFVGPDQTGDFNWGNDDWGDDGSFSGVLALTGESDCSATAGYYRIQANTTTLTYTETPTNWGIIGAATPLGWDNSTNLTYNATNKTWEGDLVMTPGEFKFRANGAWTINLGDDSDSDGSMNYDGPNLSVGAGGSYHVVLDLSNPRQYTYTLTSN